MIDGARVREREDTSPEQLFLLRDKKLMDAPVELVPVESLVASYSPRVTGEDREYARALAESEARLPPIVVHQQTMRVVDGVHRLCAARMRGMDHIEARFVSGSESDAFALAVAINVIHGKPLSLTDRVAAAERIFALHPHWSDRAVAEVVGLSATKVSDIRRTLAGGLLQGESRLGRDGRVRPLNSAHRRTLASELLRENPHASVRQIAMSVGISPATVADVRDRMRRGDNPVPPKVRDAAAAEDEKGLHQMASRHARRVKSAAELLSAIEVLRKDPSMKYSDAGRILLRMFDASAIVARDGQGIVMRVPPHCKRSVLDLMRGYAEIWLCLAKALQEDAPPVGRAL
jgi:ParB-like chromosome segregation protein Spo0J